jgi:hypothetical protein
LYAKTGGAVTVVVEQATPAGWWLMVRLENADV